MWRDARRRRAIDTPQQTVKMRAASPRGNGVQTRAQGARTRGSIGEAGQQCAKIQAGAGRENGKAPAAAQVRKNVDGAPPIFGRRE